MITKIQWLMAKAIMTCEVIFFTRNTRWKKRVSLFLLVFLLGQVATVKAEEEFTLEKISEVVFDEVKIYMVYIFDLSLLKIPIGTENLPVDPRDITTERGTYFQNQVDHEKLESLHKKIQNEIDIESNYSFVHLNDLDKGKIVLVHEKNEDIKYYYDGLFFWIEVTPRDFDLSSPIKSTYSGSSYPFSEDFSSEKEKIKQLFEDCLSDYLPPIPLAEKKNYETQKRYIESYYKDFKIIRLSPCFHISTDVDPEEEYHCQKNNDDTLWKKVVETLKKEYEEQYDAFVTVESTFEDYVSEFDEVVLLMNIKRVLRDFEFSLKNYNDFPAFYQGYRIFHNLEELDAMRAFVSSSRYAVNGIELKRVFLNLISKDRNFPPHITAIREDISVIEEDIENHTSKNEHALMSFSIFLALSIAVISFLISICSNKRLGRKFDTLQQIFLQKAGSIDREMRILRKMQEKTQKDLHRRRKLELKYDRSS